jgi:myo-inositol-1(or 4)-monophosphatase
MDLSKLKSQVQLIAHDAGQILLQYQKDVNQLQFKDKGEYNIVSAADLESDKFIITELKKLYPEITIYSEESHLTNIENKSSFMFIVDPLDGSNNFSIDLPLFSVVITLLENSQPMFTSITIPSQDIFIYSIKNEGVYLNDKKLSPVKSISKKAKMMVCENNGYADIAESTKIIQKLIEGTKRVFTHWAPSIDYYLLAIQKVDALVSINIDIEDSIGGLLICQELGYEIFNFDGAEYKFKQFSKFLEKYVVCKSREDFEYLHRLI